MDRYRFIETGFDPAATGPLEADEGAFRVRGLLTDDEYRHLATLLAVRPDAWLWMEDRSTEVEWLAHFPGLRRLRITSMRLESWSGLRHIADTLEHLEMGDGTLKRVSIAPMGDLAGLRSLYLIGPVKGVEALARLTALEELCLRSVTLPDLSLLVGLPRLHSLRLLLGGTAELGLLPELRALDELELWRIRGMRDVSVLGSSQGLVKLTLQSMSAVTMLPSLAGHSKLSRLVLDTMRGITDLRPVADAPHLEELLLIDMPQLSATDLLPLVGHPTLLQAAWGFGSERKNVEAWDLLPLGDKPFNYDVYKAREARRR